MTRREFLGSLTACGALGGCRNPWWFGESPRLRFGVISDLHVTTPESTERFRRALAYFRDRRADAVIVAGDLSDWGLKSGLRYVAETWYEVFPDDRGVDGNPVVKLFITGNHDHDGWGYGDMTLDMHVQGYSEAESLTRLGMKECWESIFHEPYAEFRRRRVKGFDFVSAEWRGLEKPENDAETIKWLDAHADEFRGERPFFFFRHAPLAGTVSSSIGRPGSVELTDCLRKFPNCIAFNGHTHWTLNDERSIWQEEFTAISVPSMSYTTLPKGYENGQAPANGTCDYSMEKLPARAELREAQGYFVSLYDTRMEVERYDFECMEDAAAPWVVPLGANRAKPYSAAVHSAMTSIPEFPAGARVKTHVTNATTRNDRWTIFMTLEFPAATVQSGRVFDYLVRVECEDGTCAIEKRFLSPGFYRLPKDEHAIMRFRVDTRDVPEKGRYRFRVYPRNCFGGTGRSIESRIFESCPGKDKIPNLYDVRNFGAKGDGIAVDTMAIQKAIDTASASGGGTVIVPKGVFLSGALFFKRGTKLRLDDGAVLKGSEEIRDYPERMTRIEGETCLYYPALVNADGVDGFAVSGNGTIDGSGYIYWKRLVERWQRIPGTDNKDEPRPRLLYVSNSKHVALSGLTLKNSAYWTAHFYKCEDVRLDGLRILTEVVNGVAGENTDAVDLDAVRHVSIRNCCMDVPNDAITLKGGKGPDAHDPLRSPESGPVEDVLVENCSFGRQCTGCLTFGSECFCGKNVIMRNCTVENVETVLRFKMRPDTRQDYGSVHVEGICGSADYALIAAPYTSHARPEWTSLHLKSVVRDVTVRIGDGLVCKKGSSLVSRSDDYQLERVVCDRCL